MRGPDDKGPDPPGGRAAERLKEFMKKRAPAKPPCDEEAAESQEQPDDEGHDKPVE